MNFSGIVLISLIAPTKVESDLILWCGRIKSILQMASERKHFQSFVSTTPRLPVPNGSLGHIPTLVNTPRACICSVSPSWARKINNSSSCRTVPLLVLNSCFKLLRFLFLLNYTQQEVLVNELFPPHPPVQFQLNIEAYGTGEVWHRQQILHIKKTHVCCDPQTQPKSKQPGPGVFTVFFLQ